MTTVCCKCLKIKTDAGWQQIQPPAANHLSSHGYCPTCHQETMKKIQERQQNQISPVKI
ncbi:MAG: hypothetical protein OEV91_07990 [Desulfobulbaceae bacterium]|nr:hypothetical protein [Desulfobulbaceae bacterium]